MRHILIIFTFSLLLLTSPVFGQSSKYEGEIKNGLPNGQGTYSFPNGDKYVGEWKDGKKNGLGTLTWSKGNKYVGEYKDDNRWNGTIYDKNENIIGTVVNGVKQ